MIIVSHFLDYVKDGIRYITGDDKVFCPDPDCGCLMKLHGRCRRYVRRPDGLRDELSLRVLYCPKCNQYHRTCGLLGIRLLYAKPRNPQGKGKQERFNHTVDSFIAEVNLNPPESVEDLNTLFYAWLSECYHHKVHSALGMTPEHAFKCDSMPLNYPDEALLS